MRRYFVVANRTLLGGALEGAIRERMDPGASSFHVIVPASPPPPKGMHAWSDGEARALAKERLDRMLQVLTGLGAECDGEVGDGNPINAVEDAIRSGRDADEILVSTLPPGASRWLRLDLPHVLASRTGIPVTHVIAATEPVRR